MERYRHIYGEMDPELVIELGISNGESPDEIMGALLRVFDDFTDVHQDPDLEELARHAISRLIHLVAEASGEKDAEATAAMLRKAAENLNRIWKWPEVDDSPGVGTGGYNKRREFSALKMFGYTVGKTNGWSEKKRQAFLSDFMELPLPDAVTRTFGDEYGAPMSTNRLRKIATHLVSRIQDASRNNRDSFRYAIADWNADLAFLKHKYYEQKGLKFQPWPTP